MYVCDGNVVTVKAALVAGDDVNTCDQSVSCWLKRRDWLGMVWWMIEFWEVRLWEKRKWSWDFRGDVMVTDAFILQGHVCWFLTFEMKFDFILEWHFTSHLSQHCWWLSDTSSFCSHQRTHRSGGIVDWTWSWHQHENCEYHDMILNGNDCDWTNVWFCVNNRIRM